MADNRVNVSRDSFQLEKFYDSVRLQEGVPIMDSDWNEMDDLRRTNDLLQMLYGFGRDMQFLDGSGYAGFEPYGNDLDNDFLLRGGAALVQGVLILSSADDPPSGFNYDSTDNIYCDNGIVTAVGSGRITDDYKYWTSLGSFGDALEPSAYQGGARVVMTSGVEDGNTFTVASVPNNTQLELSGGTGSIAPGDTYNVLPSALTTPTGSRTDEVFLMVWWEDIAGAEDDELIHPAVAIETCHRLQRKWVVRVTEGGTAPTTSGNVHNLGLRYLKIGEMARTATATISAGMVSAETDLHVANYLGHTEDGEAHGISGEYTSSTLTGANNGGIGTGLTTFESIFDAVDEGLIRRRAFTAVITDGTASTGGDFEGSDAIDEVSGTLAEGTFFVRRGGYEWSIATMASGDASGVVLGESRDAVTISIPSGASQDFYLAGKFENVSLESSSTSYQYAIASTTDTDVVVVDNSYIDAGSFVWNQGSLVVRDTHVRTTGASTNTKGFEISQSVYDTWQQHEGYFENVIFDGISSVAPTKEDTLYIYNLSTSTLKNVIKPIYFRGCIVSKTSTSRNSLRITDCTSVQLVFENCLFNNLNSTTTTTPLIYIEDAEKVIFRNCSFHNYGPLLDVRTSSVTFENCTFTDDAIGTYSAQTFTIDGSGSDGLITLRDCKVVLNSNATSATGSLPMLEIGGSGATSSFTNICVDNLEVVLPNADLHRFTPIVFWGVGDKVSYDNISIDCNGAQSGADRTTYGVRSFASVVEFVGSISAYENPLIAKNVHIYNLDNPASSSTHDSSSVVTLYAATITNLIVDGTGVGSGDMGSSRGLVFLDTASSIYNLRLFPTNEILSYTGGVAVIYMSSTCGLYGGSCTTTGITNAITNFIYCFGSNIRVSDFTGYFVPGDQSFYVIRIADETVMVSGNDIRVGDRSGETSAPIIGTTTSGSLASITKNTLVLTDTAASPIAITSAANGVLVDSNVVASYGTTAPTIVNTGTGAQTGDNVLLNNYS